MILLLTGCINPNGMAMTALLDQEERKKQYVMAINYYLTKTCYPIVFTENSGTDISNLFENAIKSGRMEYLTFTGNNNKERGKGYGECEIIHYALNNSKIIHSSKDKRIAKITGRLIIQNIKRIILTHSILFSKQTIFFAINSDLSFPDSRFIVAPEYFYHTLLKSKEQIDDSKGYYFEHAVCDTIKRNKQFHFSPFLLMPSIEGISGSTGNTYSTDNHAVNFSIRYVKYALSQQRKFKKRFRY